MYTHGDTELELDDDIWALLEDSAAGGDESSDEELCAHRRLSSPVVLGVGSSALLDVGISRLKVSPKAYAPLRGLAEALLEPNVWRKTLSTEPSQELQLGPDWPCLRLHKSVGSDRLLWIYAAEERAMPPFDALAESVANQVSAGALGSQDLRLCAGCLVVLLSPGAKESEVFAHRDWDAAKSAHLPGLPPRSAFTVLVPLVLPEGSAGLEVFDGAGQLEGVAGYAVGEAIAFDNTCLHRTQPGGSPTRILASLSFAPTSPELWPAAERVLRAQTPSFFRNFGTSPEAERGLLA
eukprot:TRINITY_DN5897_c0_g1_i1.p1 TRINITY_DN5897_c0_g1~~TRINITY_DN5897_c0_g1_i1.p1  ORF type:complete len:294 (-),score=44.37 TRINITY_DN5897_c0_g1_i1:97-978(-)